MRVSRRGLLAGAAVGGGLAVWYLAAPQNFPAPLDPADGEFAFDAWIKIARDGVVTVAVPQLEMGQGVTTLIPQIAAMELGADWRQVAVEPAPISGAYANIALAARWAPLWAPVLTQWADAPDDLLARRFAEDRHFCATAEGTTLAAYEAPVRAAAAAARAMLVEAAARRWDVAVEECEAANGFVLHEDKNLPFGELVDEAADLSPPDPPPLRSDPPAEPAPPPGMEDAPSAFPRLDLPAKVDGSWQFAGDVRLPGMVYAAIKHGPLGDAELTVFDEAAAHAVPGVVSVIRSKRWLAVAAETSWAAERAVEAAAPRFSVAALVDSGTIDERIDTALREGEATLVARRGEAASGTSDLSLRYDFAPQLHGQIEPTVATAWLHDGRLELWLASQAPEQARRAAARAAGVGLGDTVLYPMPAGGSFDRRLDHSIAIEVAAIARAVGRPVQLGWTRFQDHLAGFPRAPSAVLLSARHDAEGVPSAMRARIAKPPTMYEFGARLFDNATPAAAIAASAGKPDPLACEGFLPSYAIPGVDVYHAPVRLPLPTGPMRGGSHVEACFAIECFMDELARRHDREPLSFRIQMLSDDLRLAECLQRAARLADWNGGEAGSGRGLACHLMGTSDTGGRIAAIATATPGEGGIRVESIAAAVDIGRVVNRDIARQQVEGGLIFGLGLALGSGTDYTGGLPSAQRLAALDLPALADSPEIRVELIESDAPPFDPGELGAVVAPAAIANALYSATGLRIRRLPLISAGL